MIFRSAKTKSHHFWWKNIYFTQDKAPCIENVQDYLYGALFVLMMRCFHSHLAVSYAVAVDPPAYPLQTQPKP
jgi:hypothetical protein